MNNEPEYETQSIDHLGIVAGISREIGLVESIDEKVGQTGRKVSCGEAVLAMVLNALGFTSRALYLIPDYLRSKPVDLLIRDDLRPEDFNDDTLGRSLDDLYTNGVTEVFASVASNHQTCSSWTPICWGRTGCRWITLTGEVKEFTPGVEEARHSLGKFILATNETDSQELPAAAMLENYTAQGISVERGFRFLKDPLFFADSLFLKNPGRIMALIMIMGLALLIFSLGERQLRFALKQNNQTVPDQKRKPTQNPTPRWVFQVFEGLHVLSVVIDGRVTARKMLNLRLVHLQILNLLGTHVQACYLIKM